MSMLQSIRAKLLAPVAILALASSSARAQTLTPSSDTMLVGTSAPAASTDVITACYILPIGPIYRIKVPGAPSACFGPTTGQFAHVAFTWNVPGPAGAAGAVGPQGPQGPQGALGPAGAAGDRGPQGAPGASGPKGDNGAVGPAGPQGPQGPAGTAGAVGPKGDTGPAGAKGDAGAAGGQGSVGPAGDVGPAGPAGPMGAQGVQGPSGVGPQGPEGAQGPPGQAGPPGDPGPTGPQGNVGIGTLSRTNFSFNFSQTTPVVLGQRNTIPVQQREFSCAPNFVPMGTGTTTNATGFLSDAPPNMTPVQVTVSTLKTAQNTWLVTITVNQDAFTRMNPDGNDDHTLTVAGDVSVALYCGQLNQG